MIGGPSVDADADADVLSSALPTHVSKAAHEPVVAKPRSARARVPRRDTPRSPLTRDLFDGGHGTSESDDLDEDDLAWLAKLDGLRRVFAWRFARPLDEDQLVRADRLVRGGDAASALDGETLARACRTAHALLEPEAVSANAVVAVGHLVQVAGFRMLSPEGRAKLVRARAVDKIQRVARRHLRRAAH